MTDAPGKRSHALGRFFSLRGRTSTNVIETLFTPSKGEVDPSDRSMKKTGQSYTSSTIGDAAPRKHGDDSDAKSTCMSVNSVSPKMSTAEIFMKNNPIVMNQEVNPQSGHFRVHGADAKQYAMRALGNVDTLLNRYGYEDNKQQFYQYSH